MLENLTLVLAATYKWKAQTNSKNIIDLQQKYKNIREILNSKMNKDNINQECSENWLSMDESLKKIRLHFRLLGLNFEARSRTKFEDFIFWFNMVWMNSALLGCFHWTYIGLVKGIDITEITYVAPGATLSIIAIFKSFSLFYYEDTILKLIANLRQIGNDNDISKLTDIEVTTMKSDIKFLNTVVKILNVLNIMMLLVYDLTPIVIIAKTYYTTGKLKLMLPFLDIYPFDSLDLRYWPFLYLHQIWAEAIVLLQVCSADFLFYTCCTYIKIQFRLLQLGLVNLITERGMALQDYKELRKNFQRLVKWHQDLISAANTLELITSKSTLSNFLISSVVICLTGFNVTTTNDPNEIMTFLTFLFMSLLQVFFFCLFGDMLMRSSSEVSDAVYNCKWYLSSVSTGKNLLLLQRRAQTPCKVTAAGFADVNLRAFMKILSTSWSYFALLNTVYRSTSSRV